MIKYFIILINFLFCVGIESITLPNNGIELASANSGIAKSQNIGLNFSNINNLPNTLNISSILWYQDVKGGNIEYKWGKENHHYLSLYHLSANDIEFRAITPNDKPIDVFNIHHISFSYGFGKTISNQVHLGVKTTMIYNQLYTDESIGYNLDLGFSYDYNDLLSIGIMLNQVGTEEFNNGSIEYPLLSGLGASFNLKPIYSKIHGDIIYNNSLSNELTYKVGSTTQLPYISIITGYNYSKSKSEFSCGFSFQYSKIQFDYGVSFHKALGMPTIFSLKYHI